MSDTQRDPHLAPHARSARSRPRGPGVLLFVLLALAAGLTFVVMTLGGREPSPRVGAGGGAMDAAPEAHDEARSEGEMQTLHGEPPPTAIPEGGLVGGGGAIALELVLADGVEAPPGTSPQPPGAHRSWWTGVLSVFLGDGRREMGFVVEESVSADGTPGARIVDGDGASSHLVARARVEVSAERVLIEGLALRGDGPWWAAARTVDLFGRVLECASTRVRGDGAAPTTLALGLEAPRMGRFVARVRRGHEFLPECAVSVSEVSGLPHGRFRFAGDEPSPAEVPAGVLLRVVVTDARGLRSAGAPAAQEVTLRPGTLAQLEFALPDLAPISVRGETPRGEAVPGDLLVWRTAKDGRAVATVPVTDALASHGAAGWSGHLPVGSYRGLFVPRTEWSSRLFDLEVEPDGVVVVLDLGQDDGAALVEVELRDADGAPLADHRLTFVREAGSPDQLDWAHARTDGRGRAVLRPLVAGAWQVLDYARGVARVVDLPSGLSDLRLDLPPEPSAEGRGERLEVRALTGRGEARPLLNVHVRASGATWWRVGSAGNRAAAVFEGLAPGTYEVRVPPEWSRYADVGEGHASVLVQEGAGTTALDIRLP